MPARAEASGKADRRAVGAPAGRAREPAILVELDRVHAAGHRRHHLNVVTHGAQLVPNRLRNGRFDLERVAFGPDPRRLHRLLQAHAVIDQVEQRLQRTRKDPISAGQTETAAVASWSGL